MLRYVLTIFLIASWYLNHTSTPELSLCYRIFRKFCTSWPSTNASANKYLNARLLGLIYKCFSNAVTEMGRGYMERDRILIDAIKLLSGVTVPIYLPTEDLQEPIFSPSVCIQYNIFLPWVVLNILIK